MRFGKTVAISFAYGRDIFRKRRFSDNLIRTDKSLLMGRPSYFSVFYIFRLRIRIAPAIITVNARSNSAPCLFKAEAITSALFSGGNPVKRIRITPDSDVAVKIPIPQNPYLLLLTNVFPCSQDQAHSHLKSLIPFQQRTIPDGHLALNALLFANLHFHLPDSSSDLSF